MCWYCRHFVSFLSYLRGLRGRAEFYCKFVTLGIIYSFESFNLINDPMSVNLAMNELLLVQDCAGSASLIRNSCLVVAAFSVTHFLGAI